MIATGVYRDAPAINAAMGRVYGHMFLAVVTSMIVSAVVGTNPALMAFFFTGIMKWIVLLAPLVFVFLVPVLLNAGLPKIGKVLTLHSFAALMGLSFSAIFVIFTMGSIFGAFMGAAILFGVMSLYGYFTKQSLDSIGKYLFVALIAIIIVSIVNLFIGSSVLQMVLSAVSVLVFLGLTAYDTQQIREMVSVDNDDSVEIMGALTLYLDFINLFINLLQLFGVTKGNDD